MVMRSAIYYPSIEIRSPAMMHSSLLLWDKLNVIVPNSNHEISYADKKMAEMWELLGGKIVPSEGDKHKAHNHIADMLKSGLPVDLKYHEALPHDNIIELWPDKLMAATWQLLKQHEATGNRLANGDYPFEQQAGTAVMAKIADACGGETFARVTDRMLAFGLLADHRQPSPDQRVVPITLDLVDLNAIPIDRLIDMRRREQKEQRGNDYRAMRHAYANAVQAHVDLLKTADNLAQVDEMNRQFRQGMDTELKDLKDALGYNTMTLLFKPVIVASVVGAGMAIAAGTGGMAAALVAGGAAIGSSLPDIAKHIASMFEAGLGFSDKQRAIMAQSSMAYMYQLAKP